MLISASQHDANVQNAQHSSGPTSETGKAKVRFNALKYGLRTSSTFIPGEIRELYYKVWDEFQAEWQPQTRTERAYIESMVNSQWLLLRMAQSEQDIYLDYPGDENLEQRLKLLAYVYKFRAQLDRQFRNAVADLTKAQEKRHASRQSRADLPGRARLSSHDLESPAAEGAVPPSSPPTEPDPATPPPQPKPTWLMSAPPGLRPIVVCALPSSKPDSR